MSDDEIQISIKRVIYAIIVVVFIGMIQSIYANALVEPNKPVVESVASSTNISAYSQMTTTNTPTTKTATTATRQKSKYNFSKKDMHLIELVVMNEVGHCSETSQIAVANVILNRYKSKEFPNTIKEIVFAKGQFTCSFNMQPNKNTKVAVKKALEGVDNSKGALYYYAPKYVKARYIIRWFENLDLCFELEGQRFFK